MRPRRSIAFLLAVVSGAAALGHQLLWTRRLADVLGASAGTFSKVIGAFFLGLALGAWLASRAGARPGNFWRRVALAEWAVATLALPMLLSASFADVAHRHPQFEGGLKLLLAPLLITPPATAMGLVTPWMVRALSSGSGFAPKHAVWLYAVNTLGGVAGLVAVVLDWLPRIGLAGASVSVIGLNVLVGLGALALARERNADFQSVVARAPDRRGAAAPADANSPGDAQPTGSRPHAALEARAPMPPANRLSPSEKLLAFASGFLVLASEVVLQHQLAQVTINSLFSSAMVLALVLVALAVAAALLPWLMPRIGDERCALRWALVAAAVSCAAQPFVLTGLRGGMSLLPYELPPLPYAWEVAKLGLPAVCLPLLAAGLVFPLLLSRCDKTSPRPAGGANRQPRGTGHPLRRSTRRYRSQRDRFHLLKMWVMTRKHCRAPRRRIQQD